MTYHVIKTHHVRMCGHTRSISATHYLSNYHVNYRSDKDDSYVNYRCRYRVPTQYRQYAIRRAVVTSIDKVLVLHWYPLLAGCVQAIATLITTVSTSLVPNTGTALVLYTGTTLVPNTGTALVPNTSWVPDTVTALAPIIGVMRTGCGA